MLQVVAVMLLLQSNAFAAANEDPLLYWQPDAISTHHKIKFSPQHALSELLANPPLSEDSDLVKGQYYALLSLAYYELSFPAKALSNIKKSLNYIDEEGQPWFYHQARLVLAQAHSFNGNPSTGLPIVKQAIGWARSHSHERLLAYALYVSGLLRKNITDFNGALEDLQQAYQLTTLNSDVLGRADVANILGQIYEQRNENELAIPFFEQAELHFRKVGNHMGLSVVLYGKGVSLRKSGALALAKDVFEESKHLAELVLDEQGIAYAIKELAYIEQALGNNEKAKAQAEKALALFKKSENPFGMFETYKALAFSALSAKQYSQAKSFFELAYDHFQPDSMVMDKFVLDEEYARYLAETGDFEEAYSLLASTVGPKQNYHSENSTKQLHAIRSHYDLDVKEREFKLLEQKVHLQNAQLAIRKKENTLLVLVSSAAVVICALLLSMAIRSRNHKNKLQQVANLDELTGVYNRTATFERLEHQINYVNRYGGPLSLLLFNVDGMQVLDSKLGHTSTDKIIQTVGKTCKSAVRNSDIVGRVGTGEFVIALPNTQKHEAEELAEAICAKINTRAHVHVPLDTMLRLSFAIEEYLPPQNSDEFYAACARRVQDTSSTKRDGSVNPYPSQSQKQYQVS